jgi:hypothetical protein
MQRIILVRTGKHTGQEMYYNVDESPLNPWTSDIKQASHFDTEETEPILDEDSLFIYTYRCIEGN